jgi:hypothetical protein
MVAEHWGQHEMVAVAEGLTEANIRMSSSNRISLPFRQIPHHEINDEVEIEGRNCDSI